MSGFFAGIGRGVGLIGVLGSLVGTLRAVAEQRVDRWNAAWRLELRRVALVLSLALALAFFICAAVTFAMLSLLMSFWDEHPVLGAGLVAAGFAVLALVAALIMRNSTR